MCRRRRYHGHNDKVDKAMEDWLEARRNGTLVRRHCLPPCCLTHARLPALRGGGDATLAVMAHRTRVRPGAELTSSAPDEGGDDVRAAAVAPQGARQAQVGRAGEQDADPGADPGGSDRPHAQRRRGHHREAEAEAAAAADRGAWRGRSALVTPARRRKDILTFRVCADKRPGPARGAAAAARQSIR